MTAVSTISPEANRCRCGAFYSVAGGFAPKGRQVENDVISEPCRGVRSAAETVPGNRP